MGKHLTVLRNWKKASVDRPWWTKGKAVLGGISEGGRSQIIQDHVYYFGLGPKVDGESLKYSK